MTNSIAMQSAAQSEALLEAEKPRLVPDPAALEAEVGAIDIAQLARMVNEQSSVISHQSSEEPKTTADSSGSAVGIQDAQPRAAVPHENRAENSSAAWKQDPAAQGGNFAPDQQVQKSAKELDEKVGQEQAKQAAEDQGKPCKGVPNTEYQVPSSTADGTGKDDDRAAETNCGGGGSKKGVKKKYDVRKIGERGIGGGMNFFSIDREIKMGAELAKEIDSQSKFFTDEKITEYVNRLAQNLARNSDLRVPISVKVVDSEELNAFSLPGGRLYVNVGMIMAAESEAELAGIMAHEIAHVAARHATKNETKRQLWNFASIPLMFVGGPAGMAVQNVVQVAVPMTFMKFSRNAEREADLLGIEYEYAAGYDPSAMVNFFEKLQSKDKKKPNFVVRAFQTHPMSDDRLKRAQETIEEMLPEKNDYLISTSEFDEIKARLNEMTANKLRFGTKGSKDEKPKLKTRGMWQ
jgi:Zn-dependent protease with chaperone function